jgi:tetrahydromethanopterin S-methyltransferase subunit D
LAGLGVGIVTGILTFARASDVRKHCDAYLHCDQAGFDAASEGKVLSPVSTVSVIAGSALLALGGALVIWSFRKPRTSLATTLADWGSF